jgi:hypothetical protein
VSPRQVDEVIIGTAQVSTHPSIKALSRRAGLESRVIGRFDDRDELPGRQIWDWVRAESSRWDDESAVKECCEDECILERDSLIMETAVRKIRYVESRRFSCE